MIGHRIVEEIVCRNLSSVSCPEHPEAWCLTVWSAGAAEQLEALVESHVAARTAALEDALRIAHGAFSMCDANLCGALVEIENLRAKLKP